ncbi:MAG: response regulator [Candidatus Abyssobacteria bacterium SURF_5]|uniref:histidine kinase n=1 Tax=Abyssobacteria bacterium (strain SURF_5) TaxID=2093360 RepID=A0A3A4NY30_ABYX5|nr:MAG: response regulator [Candidatus Abyssubacteria bacterium SURF_5]
MTARTSKERGRILVVDDDLINAELLQTKLAASGYDVAVAHTAEKAFSEDRRFQPHLILLDVVMPEMSGFELCRQIMKIHENKYVPIILVTSMDDLRSKVKGLESGAYDYVTKPFDSQELLARVRSAMRTKTLYDELSATREKLTEAEKLAALGEMAIMLHHEINNPLQAVVLSAENMQSDLQEGVPLSGEDIEIILKSCSRIQEVLQRITRLKRVRSAPYVGQMGMLDLGKSTDEEKSE